MKKAQLSKHWWRWRRRRYQELAARGLASDLAWDVAAVEADYRQMVGRLIGKERAESAEITFGDRGFALVGETAGLTAGQVQAIRNLSQRTTAPAA